MALALRVWPSFPIVFSPDGVNFQDGDACYLLADPRREPYAGQEPLDSLGSIRLEDVHFRYGDEGEDLLAGADLEIAPSARVASLGANGSSKSSLAALIGAFWRPQRGRLTTAGIAYDRLDPRALRRRMAFVPQQPFLFAGTVRENVTYGTENSGAFEQALREAGAYELVDALPNGAETTIGEDGVRLSGGQRQKLAIARPLLRRPDLLVLDEPTNHFDEAATVDLTVRLSALRSRPAVLSISHEARVPAGVHEAWQLTRGRLEQVK